MSPFADPLYATLLVLVVTNTRVLLAADSRKNTLYPDGRREEGTMDKIFRTGDCYYAVSGFNSTADDTFSLQSIIHKTRILYPGFSTAVKHIARTLASELKAYLAVLKKSSPLLLEQLLSDSQAGGEIVLIERVKEVPSATLLSYRISSSDRIKVVVESWSINTTDIKDEEDCFWRAIGNTAFLAVGMPLVKEVAQSPVPTIKRMVEVGAKAHPHFISGPVNIVELTPEGVHWIEKSTTAPAHV
jgi:hypothetical protein